MAWKEISVVDQRMRFVLECESGVEAMAVVCRVYGISRKVGYKWLGRYRAEGVDGLKDRRRVPHHHPYKVSEALEAAILAARAAHPTWGPKKLLVLLKRQRPRTRWPARSTIAQILRRYGLSFPRKRRRRVPRHEGPFAACDGPNTVWCADFKGWFRTADGRRCEPLTISDAYSRYLLRCQVSGRTDGQSVRPLFEAAFRQYGLPYAIRTDNGSPFASRGFLGLTALSLWWVKLGIRPERIEAGHPEQNGRHERMHLTLKQETASPPAANLRRQQERFDAFRAQFNEVRPHEALEMRTPSSLYVRSSRRYPERLDVPEYPSGWAMRRVAYGRFRWKGANVFIAHVLHGEPIGLEPIDGRYWRAWFGSMSLGILDGDRKRMLNRNECRRAGLPESLWGSPFRYAPGTAPEP